jgi:predicted nucleic acid-binding protein
MRRVVLADTGPLYAALDPNDQYHLRAQEELKRLTHERRSVVIAYPILFESYSLVLYRLGKQTASSWFNETMEGANLVNPTAQDYRDAADKLLAFADQRITLFDATVAVLAQRLGLQVWTYDHHFDVMRASVWR